MADFSFEDFNFGSGNDEYDFSGLADIGLGTDVQELDLSSLLGGGGQDIDFSGFDNLDISSLLDSGDQGIDFSQVAGDYGSDLASELAAALQDTGNASSIFSDDGGLNIEELLKTEGGTESLSRSLASLASDDKDTSGGTGLSTKGLDKLLTSTGRGQLAMVDPITGATGITGEGFTSLQDLLGSGTKEEIARYSPETVDYGFRSGLETKDGQGLSGDSTRGMGLEQMGGGQGLSKYIPAEYSESALTQLVKNNPGKFPEIENYLDSQYDKAGLTPFRGSGGTLSETGFLAQSSKANPLGSMYSIGDPKSFINNPTITGQQSVVSPGRTIIDNKDGTYKVVTNTVDGTKTITTNKDGVDKIIRETRTIDNTKANQGAKAAAADKKDNNMLLMLLALMAMMNKGGGESKGSGAVIPSLSADRKQLPYGPISGSKARPGAGGVSYFSPTTYTQKAAGGGLMSLAGNGIARYAGNEGSLVGGDAALEAYQRGDYKTANDLLGKAGMGAQDVVSKYGLSQADAATVAKNLGYAGDMSGIKYAAPPVNQTANVQNLPVIPDDNASNTSYEKVGLGTFRGRPIINPADTDAQISNYYDKNKNLFDSKDYNKIASDMFVNEFTPEALARVKGFDQKAVTDLYNKTYGAFDRATQENLVNQKYKKQFGLTDKQLGEIGFGANVFSGEDRPENIRLNNAYGRYQDELAAAGRYDAPADAYYRTKAVYKPDERGRKNGRIELIDTVTGQQLTSFGAGQKSGQIFGLLDKFGVDPTSFKNAFKTAVDLPNNSGYRKDDYDSLMGYKARNLSGKTDEYLTKPLKNLTVGDLKPKYEKDDNNRQTADSKINVFYEIPMTNLLKSKGLSGNEASKLLSQFRPVAGLVNFAEISRSKDPVKAMIGTLNTLQSKGLINLDPNTGPLSKIGQSRFDAAGKKLPARYKGTESLQSLGLKGLASGGISSFAQSNQMSNLGGYSDGGRLLRGPGDGVSDSIPATIGGKQPARLAEGEFVVPARIVSELGNGSTNAGAQKLYAMMDRVQNARRKTKNVAANTKAHKYLPA